MMNLLSDLKKLKNLKLNQLGALIVALILIDAGPYVLAEKEVGPFLAIPYVLLCDIGILVLMLIIDWAVTQFDD